MDSLEGLKGQIVPWRFEPGYVVLSFFISFIGSWTTLEIINKRTAVRGIYNWLHLAAASISMGGIAIWSMHFLGDHAVILGGGENELQIAYSPLFTILSFFVPVIVFFLDFWVLGLDEKPSVYNVMIGGVLAGLGILAMHYLGNKGISNYNCDYNGWYFTGAWVIATVASIGSLALFFLLWSFWNKSWWKRLISGSVLAVAVSGMHWVASAGTHYQLMAVNSSSVTNLSRRATVIVVIVMSVGACFTLLIFTFLSQRRDWNSEKRAQQVVLATAFFDHEGKILVTPEGRLPARKITDSWLERSLNDAFNTDHSVFLWMFRTSRYWSGIKNLLPGMRAYVHRAGIKGRLGSADNLIDDEGEPISDYSIAFRELYCIAAGDLAADLDQPLEQMGVLYDEILQTGNAPKDEKSKNKSTKSKRSEVTVSSSLQDVERDGGSTSIGRGQLLFLVRRVGRKEAGHLEAAGFRFATPVLVNSVIAQSLQVGPHTLARRLELMCKYAYEPQILDPGVHLAYFAIRASLARKGGFDVLARKDAKNELPTMQVSSGSLEVLVAWQCEYLLTMDSKSVSEVQKLLFRDSKPKNPSEKAREFAQQLLAALEALKVEIEDPLFNDALLIAKPVKAPCRGRDQDSPPGAAMLITFQTFLPIGSRAPGKKLTFIPLNFFKAEQHVYPNSPDHIIYANETFREFSPFLDTDRRSTRNRSSGGSHVTPDRFHSSSIRKSRQEALMGENLDMYGNVVDQTQSPDRGPSKVRFWDKNLLHSRVRGENSSEKNLVTHMEGRVDSGIMVSQDVTMNVSPLASPNIPANMSDPFNKHETIEMDVFGKKRGITTEVVKEEHESATFVDELFTTTIRRRRFG